MQKLIKIVLLFLTVISLNALELKHADSYKDAIEQGIKESKSIVLFAHHPQCPYCRKMEANTLSDKKVIKLLNEKFIFVSVDVSLDMEIEDVPSEFIPAGTPTTYVIDPKTQKKLYSLRGYKSASSFLSRLTR